MELAKLIWQKVYGDTKDLSVEYEEPFTYDVQKRIPSVEKAERVLGFTAVTPLSEVLDEVIPWVRQAIADGTI